jgi:uncharacterized membrane protein
MILYAAIATPLTAAAGLMWAFQFPAPAAAHLPGLSTHMWLGLFLTITFGVLTVWRGKIFAGAYPPGAIYLLSNAVVVAALMYQGFLGGQMTIG